MNLKLEVEQYEVDGETFFSPDLCFIFDNCEDCPGFQEQGLDCHKKLADIFSSEGITVQYVPQKQED